MGGIRRDPRPLLPGVEWHGSANDEPETITDDRLIEALSALGRLVDPMPWSVRAEARAVFRRGLGARDPDVQEMMARLLSSPISRGPVGVG